MELLRNISWQESMDSLETILASVEMPDTIHERISVFEDIIIDAFIHIVIGNRIPALTIYFDMVLQRYPQLRSQIKNQLGQFGVKALAGVPVVMLKDVDSDIVRACLPSLIPMLLHHLLEVVSDKIESKTLAERFNISDEFASEFAKNAYEMMGGRSFEDIQHQATLYLNSLDIHELDLSQLDPQFNALFGGDNIRYLFSKSDYTISALDMGQIGYVAQNPIKCLLLFNLIVIENATHHLHHAYIWTRDNQLIDCGSAELFNFAMQSLCARYFSVAVTHDPGYSSMDLHHAIETRADSILTNYTMSCVISALAVANEAYQKQLQAEQYEIENLIHYGTQLIGLANDCGFRLLRLTELEIRQELQKLMQLEAYPRPSEDDNRIVFLHQQAKRGQLEQRYLALFPIIKDIAKGEHNLALDCQFDPTLEGWDRVVDNVIKLSEQFQSIETTFQQYADSIQFKEVARLIENFIQYNYQIYDLGADYDHQLPVIEHLEIMK